MIVPRDYQDGAVTSIFNYFASGKTGNPLVAMPTGTGKSVVIADFCSRVLRMDPSTRFMVLTHVKELIEQNAKKMQEIWPTAPVGIYSAGLKSRDTDHAIIFGGVQSVVNSVRDFGLRHLLLIDEAHIVSPNDESRYQKVITGLKMSNPNLKVIGFTATAYRTGQGSLADVDSLFTDICCDQTSMQNFNWFIQEGYLCPLIPKQTGTELDVSQVAISNGDYKQDALQSAVDRHEITYKCCMEICKWGQDRRSWLIFTSGIEHAEHVAECLRYLGVSAVAVHSKTPKDKRDEHVTSFKNGMIRCLVNNGVFTTGFDYPGLDLIGMLRPTTSAGLWVQMLGRGTRPLYRPGFDLSTRDSRLAAMLASPKHNCLVLDFAGNTKRLGPINDPVIPRKRKKGETPGLAPVKICDICGTYNHAAAPVCDGCGRKFERQSKLTASASTHELIRDDKPKIEEYPVQRVLYSKHEKTGAPPMLKVSYFCGLQYFKEIKCFEHRGFGRTDAVKWWKARCSAEPPKTVAEALASHEMLRQPKAIRVNKAAKYPAIVEYVW